MTSYNSYQTIFTVRPSQTLASAHLEKLHDKPTSFVITKSPDSADHIRAEPTIIGHRPIAALPTLKFATWSSSQPSPIPFSYAPICHRGNRFPCPPLSRSKYFHPFCPPTSCASVLKKHSYFKYPTAPHPTFKIIFPPKTSTYPVSNSLLFLIRTFPSSPPLCFCPNIPFHSSLSTISLPNLLKFSSTLQFRSNFFSLSPSSLAQRNLSLSLPQLTHQLCTCPFRNGGPRPRSQQPSCSLCLRPL